MCSVDVTVHCVAPSLDAFDDLRVAATLYRVSGEPVLEAEPAAIKTDVWMAADTAGLADRAAAGYGGSAKVPPGSCAGWSGSRLARARRTGLPSLHLPEQYVMLCIWCITACNQLQTIPVVRHNFTATFSPHARQSPSVPQRGCRYTWTWRPEVCLPCGPPSDPRCIIWLWP